MAVRSHALAATPWLATTRLQDTFSILNSVFCTSRANCWAGGERGFGKTVVNQMWHYNGKTWRKFSVPNPGGTTGVDLNELFAVRCPNATDYWAVGEYDKRGASHNLALHWNGRKWSNVATPAPGGSLRGDINELFDSTCTSSKSCWAVGDFGRDTSSGARNQNEVLHWNGKKWSRADLANPAGFSVNHLNELFSVRCLSAAKCIAAGEARTSPETRSNLIKNEAFRWNGRRWSLVTTPNPGGKGVGDSSEISALACDSRSNCWGAGSASSAQPVQNP